MIFEIVHVVTLSFSLLLAASHYIGSAGDGYRG
jgi:hypothetical protein